MANNATDKDVIRWLQSYKSYLRQLTGYAVHACYNSGEISWVKKEEPMQFDGSRVDRSPVYCPGLPEQYLAGVMVKMVDGWLSMLTLQERHIMFLRYVDHDFERPKSTYEIDTYCEHGNMAYKTLSYREIGERLMIDKNTAYKIRCAAIRKIEAAIEEVKTNARNRISTRGMLISLE